MDDLIQRLDSWLRQNRPEFYQQLLPSLSDKELANFEKTLGVELPDDFKLLYQWKNGEQDDYISFIHNLGWVKAEYVMSGSRSEPLVESDGYITWTDEMWEKDKSIKWVTFLSDSTAHEYILDLVGVAGGKKGQIVSFWSDELGGDYIIHESFYKWFETTVIALEKGLFEYNPQEGMAAKDEEIYDQFYKENNPGYPIAIWKG